VTFAAPRIQTIPVGPLQCNCSILLDEATGEALVIDPGDEPDKILRALDAMKARPVALLHTHAHFDHIGGTRAVKEKTGAAIRLHPADRPLYDALLDQAAMFGISAGEPLPIDSPLADRERISFGRHSVTAIHTPGHTPGSTCYLLSGEAPALFAGDTLFRRSIGRTDLWGGDTDTILDSIRTRLYSLPEDTPVVCGHGPGTTIGEEKRANPFVRG
jgi:hydroxyacylglutathione hydrolase